MSGGMVLVDVSGKASTVMTTKGDIIDFDTERQRLAIGSENQVLQVTAGGLPAWQTLAAGGATVNSASAELGSNFTTTSSSLVDITGFTLTVPTITSGKCFIVADIRGESSTTSDANAWSTALDDDGSVVGYRSVNQNMGGGGYQVHTTNPYVMDTDGSTITGQVMSDGAATAKVLGGGTNRSVIYALGVG
jgi:hypothetical protein